METFDFPLHTFTVRYPEGPTMKFGKGYSYGVKPLLPVSRTFVLSFKSMRWYSSNGGATYNATTHPEHNMKALLDFYDRHQMWKRFIYPNALYGNSIVRFSKPFELPQAHEGGSGWTKEFDLELSEQAA